MPLRTQRLLLRRFHPEDGAAFAAYRSDPQVARYQGWDPPLSPAAAVALVDEFAALDPARPGWFQYAIELTEKPGLIGDVGVKLHENRLQAEIGFTLAASHQGLGFATEAVQRVLAHLFLDRRVHRVSAECDARNAASIRLLGRLGFVQEGLRREYTWIHGEWTDDTLFGLLASSAAGRP